MAAAEALAALAREPVPPGVLRAYACTAMPFGPEYLLPKPLDPRAALWVAPAAAEAAVREGVARRPLDLAAYRESLRRRLLQETIEDRVEERVGIG